MRIMYIAPRFHTNQAPAVKGWIDRGDEVQFLSYYTALIEDYTSIRPVVLGFSPVYYLIDKIYVDILHRKDVAATAFKINHGFPPIGKLRKRIKSWKPDVIIMRDRTFYTIVSYLIGRRSKCILYNQSPLWDLPPKQDFAHRLVRHLTPRYRMTPVLGREGGDKQVEQYSYFVPFAVQPQMAPEQKKYFRKDRINILCIGKYEPRKNHMMLIDVAADLAEEMEESFHLEILGEATGRNQKSFYAQVEKHLKDKNCEGLVTLHTNVPRRETDHFFAQADVFVIPSTDEMASISQLEAMSFSVPVICSDTNGSACYIEEGKNGYLFKDQDRASLKESLKRLADGRMEIAKMGAYAYRCISEKYTFQNYYEGIMQILKDMDEGK